MRNSEFGEIPRKGIVGIVGDNESGKSTILEAITCSIFGRTVKVQEDSIVRFNSLARL